MTRRSLAPHASHPAPRAAPASPGPRPLARALATSMTISVVAVACSAVEGPLPPETAGETPGEPVMTGGPDGSLSQDLARTPPDAAADAGNATITTLPDPGTPATCGLTPCAPGGPCPDLVVDVDALRASTIVSTRDFASTDCAVVEGCIDAPGTRRLLRFTTATANVGTGDLTVGDPATGACFQWSPCHMHYHFQGFSQYTLYQPDGVTVAARGHKQSFCLEDTQAYPPSPAPAPAQPFNCNDQGLHVGWEDVYSADIDCQWVDITGVPAGTYLLEVDINTAGYLPESNTRNDSATVEVTIPPE